MDDTLKQALADFEAFLSGVRAPALIGHSLATVVAQDVRIVADAVVKWAYGREETFDGRVEAVIAARNKVFDIFFYRVVRFQRIYDFFPPFERAILKAVPAADQPYIQAKFDANPWREIRPLGSFRDPQEFALEHRTEAAVKVGEFNEDLYKNTTHQILSADRRYTFDTAGQSEQIGKYQAQVAEVFDDFVNLLEDSRHKREIQMANAADRVAVYANRPRFQIENYLCQLADLAIALFNDDFFEHSMQVFGVLRHLATESSLKAVNVHRLQEKAALFDVQKLGEIGGTKTGALLLREVLPLFQCWQQERLLQLIFELEDRRERKLMLALLEAYGREAYELLVNTLLESNVTTPWYFVRNLAYLIGRIVTDQEDLKNQAVDGLAPHLHPKGTRQVNQQVVQALGHIANERAVTTLIVKLQEFQTEFRDRVPTEMAHKLVAAMIASEHEKAVEAAFNFCLEYDILEQYRDQFARLHLPARLRQSVISRIRREATKLRFSFTLIGDQLVTKELLSCIGRGGDPEVLALCDEILKKFPARSEVGAEAARIKALPPAPPLLAADRQLHRFLSTKDLAQVFCHIYDAGMTGRIEVESKAGIFAEAEIQKGEICCAAVPAYYIEGENAFYWTVLLEPKDVGSVRYMPNLLGRTSAAISIKTADLLRNGLFQKGEADQILQKVLSPDSRFSRRAMHDYYSQFEREADPKRFKQVWEAIADDADLKTIQERTKLNRHEVCKILFYLLRNNMVVVDAAKRNDEAITAADSLTAIALAVAQIRAQPVQFQAYRAAAEAAAYLARHATNDAIAAVGRGLGSFFIEAYRSRRVLVAKHLELCEMSLSLASRYLRSGAAADRQELADFISFSFAEASAPEGITAAPASPLEQLENIEAANDPFDHADGLFEEGAIDDLFNSLDDILNAPPSGQTAAAPAGLTASEESMLLELFGNIAVAYVKPFKDFVRELERNKERQAPTSSDWLEFALPSVSLLAGAAEKMGYDKLRGILSRIERAVTEQRAELPDGAELPRIFCDRIVVEYQRLEQLLPSTFALQLTEEEIAAKKEGLIVKFILKQLPEVDERVMNKILFAGLGSFERFMEIPPAEIAQVTGIAPALAEAIYMKFYQYQDLYYRANEPDALGTLASLFEIGLNSLRELQREVERLAQLEAAGKDVPVDKRRETVAERQRTMWSLFALLCIRGEHDLVEKLQLTVFEERVRILEDYFAALAMTVA